MDFELGPAAEEVRERIRDFLRREFSEEDRLRVARDGGGHDWPLYRKLAADGWVSAGWPKEFGGQGRGSLEILALYWELSKAGFPWIGLLNNGFIGHTLLALGTDYHKQKIVPRIASGELLFALGYSEPGSGSDVAAARTTARREGEEWVIDGQKMWTTTGHVADYIFTLVRTRSEDRPHRGLTIFLIDTKADGVDIQPIRTMPGERSNAVYLSDVRVPDVHRVGEVDQGWRVVRFALGLEQAMGFADLQEAFVETTTRWALTANEAGDRPFDDVRVREQLGQTAIHAEVARLLRYRSAWMESRGDDVGGKGAMTKSFSAARYLEDATAWMELVGPQGILEHGDPFAVSDGAFAEIYRQTPLNTIYGGTVEILRSLIAEIELGLPKSR